MDNDNMEIKIRATAFCKVNLRALIVMNINLFAHSVQYQQIKSLTECLVRDFLQRITEKKTVILWKSIRTL